ncbi:MAG TPA: glycosyltransferase [Rhizomicrobium sp.]|jgi:hypothetical protein|nr:glycosyltransferase [Rhizomicrobium sp.]
MIAIPCAVQGRWSSFWACVSELNLPPRVVIRTGRGCSPATNRNGLIDEAFALGAEWIWFLDDDLTFGPDALIRLLQRFEDPKVDAVVPLSFRRQPPFRALWFDRTEPSIEAMKDTLPPPGELVPLTAATFGGLLMRTAVLRTIPKPYVALGQFVPDQWDDDLYFCRKLSEAGVQLWGDSSVQFGHTTDVEVWPHYSAETGWSVVFARGTVPFLMQPWGADVPEFVEA